MYSAGGAIFFAPKLFIMGFFFLTLTILGGGGIRRVPPHVMCNCFDNLGVHVLPQAKVKCTGTPKNNVLAVLIHFHGNYGRILKIIGRMPVIWSPDCSHTSNQIAFKKKLKP